MMLIELMLRVFSALPYLAGNATVFTVAYFYIKGDFQEEKQDLTEQSEKSEADANPDPSVWHRRILDAGLVICVILPTVWFLADKWTRLFRSELGHDGSVGLCDLLLSCVIWGVGTCVLDKLLPGTSSSHGSPKTVKTSLPYIRWTLISLCSIIFTNAWYNAHLVRDPCAVAPVSLDPTPGLFFAAGLAAYGRVVMDAMAGIAIAGWFSGGVPARSFEAKVMRMLLEQLLLLILCAPLLDAKSPSPDSLPQISIFKDFMSEHQLVFFGGETAKALLWAGYAWFIITYFGAMFGILWRFDMTENRSEQPEDVDGDPVRPLPASRSNVFIRSFTTTLLVTCLTMSYYPDTRSFFISVPFGGQGLIWSILFAKRDVQSRLFRFKVEPRSVMPTDGPAAEVLKQKISPV